MSKKKKKRERERQTDIQLLTWQIVKGLPVGDVVDEKDCRHALQGTSD